MSTAPTEPVTALTPYQRKLFVFLSVATFFEGFDYIALTQLLPSIRAAYGLTYTQGSLMVSAINIGAVTAYALIRYADVVGPGLAGATAYEIQRAADSTFSSPESSGWIVDTDHTFGGLPNGVHQFYRVRARFGSVESDWSAVVFSTQDATAPSITLALPPGQNYTTMPAIALQGTASDASGIQSITANGGLANTSDAFAHWNSTLPKVSLGQNAVIVVAADQATPPNTATLLRTVTRQLDSDGDRLPDDWEVQNGLDPHDNGSGLGRNGLLGDANGNGIVNLLEYVLASDAVVSNGLVQATRQRNPADGNDYLVVTYRRRIGLADFRFVIETSEDLVAWSAVSGDVQEILPTTPNGDGSTETVSVRIRPALGIGGIDRKVARLRLIAN